MTYKKFLSQSIECVHGNDTAEWRGMDVMLDYIRLTDILMVQPYQHAPCVHRILTPWLGHRQQEKIIYFHNKRDISKHHICPLYVIHGLKTDKEIYKALNDFCNVKSSSCLV